MPTRSYENMWRVPLPFEDTDGDVINATTTAWPTVSATTTAWPETISASDYTIQIPQYGETARRARWKEVPNGKDFTKIVCSACGGEGYLKSYKYCPHCGAKIEDEKCD